MARKPSVAIAERNDKIRKRYFELEAQGYSKKAIIERIRGEFTVKNYPGASPYKLSAWTIESIIYH